MFVNKLNVSGCFSQPIKTRIGVSAPMELTMDLGIELNGRDFGFAIPKAPRNEIEPGVSSGVSEGHDEASEHFNGLVIRWLCTRKTGKLANNDRCQKNSCRESCQRGKQPEEQ